MTRGFMKNILRFRRSEKGGLAVEFVILFPCTSSSSYALWNMHWFR